MGEENVGMDCGRGSRAVGSPSTAEEVDASQPSVVCTTQQEVGSLPEPTDVVNLASLTNLVLLMERGLSKRREAAEERRDAAEKSQESQEKKAVAEMRQEARDVWKGALTSGFVSIGGGCLQLAGAGLSAHSLSVESSATKLAEEGKKAADTAEKLGEKGAMLSEKATEMASRSKDLMSKSKELGLLGGTLGATKGIFDGASKLAGGHYESEVKEDQANTAERNNAAQASSRHAHREDESAHELGELRQKMCDRLDQMINAEQQSRLAMIQRA